METKVILTAVIAYKGNYLIVKRKAVNKWEFVSGFANDKTIEERITEIVKEKTNLDCKIQKRGIIFEINDEHSNSIIVPFFVTTLSNKVLLDKDEYEEFKFVSRDEIKNYNTVNGTIESIDLVVHKFTKIDKEDKREIIKAHYSESEWVMDPKGYFLIKIDEGKGEIQVAFCNSNNKIVKEIHGKTAKEVAYTIVRENLVSRLDHAAYLGAELTKAEYAMKRKEKYVQDEVIKE